MRTLVVIPTYNERPNIARLVRVILAMDVTFDVLIVDDNSPDGSGFLADSLAAITDRVRVLHRTDKQGLASAYTAGFHDALERGYQYCITIAADWSHNPADLLSLRAPLTNDASDVVLGSRWLTDSTTDNMPWQRELVCRSGAWYASTILGIPINDLTTSFRCIHRRVLAALDLDAMQASGYGFQIELTCQALRAGFRVSEMPISYTERAHAQGKLSQQFMLGAMLMLWRLRWKRQRLHLVDASGAAPDVSRTARRSRMAITTMACEMPVGKRRSIV